MKISSKEYQKFSKQIILKKIGVIGQQKLKSAKVLVLGMGGLGCPLSIYLASLGIGTIGIVDNDKVELSNLNRQIIYNTKDIGKYKVNVAKNKIKLINKKIIIKSYKVRVNKNNIEKLIKNFDIICDGTDNFQTRLLVNDHVLKQQECQFLDLREVPSWRRMQRDNGMEGCCAASQREQNQSAVRMVTLLAGRCYLC